MKTVNVLFTSVGRRIELIRGFKKAIDALGIKGRLIGTDIDALSPALQVVDAPILVPPFTSPDYIPCLVDICNRESIHLVFPLIDPDIPVLAQNKDTIEKTGARVAVVSQHAATTTADKLKTSRFFEEIPVSTPRSWLPDQIDSGQMNYPLFVKPRFGSGSKNIFKVRNEKELQFFANYVPDPLVQEYLSGPEITNDVISSIKGEVWAVVSRKRIEVRWGEVCKGVTVHDKDLRNDCLKIAGALSAIGPITVQCILKEGVPFFTEINARFAGGSPLTIAAGVDFPRWYLAEAAGLLTQVPPLGTYQNSFYLTRFDESFFLAQEQVEKISSRRL